MENFLGSITNAKILKGGKGGLNGLVIEVSTDINVINNSLVKIDFEEKTKYFEVGEIETLGGNLLIRASEKGYWGSALSRSKSLDLRKLVGVTVFLETDEEIKRNIESASQYC